MTRIGKHNGLTDVAGITVGHYTDTDAASGVTVVICAEGAVTGVDVRGSAPCTRETDLLAPANIVEHTQAVVLSGGSVFGLAAAAFLIFFPTCTRAGIIATHLGA